jgi:hypothetical protein
MALTSNDRRDVFDGFPEISIFAEGVYYSEDLAFSVRPGDVFV